MTGPRDAVNFTAADLLAIDHTLDGLDPVARRRACVEIDRLRRGGATILIASHDEYMLRQVCDEVWWIHEGKLHERGDAATVMDAYLHHVADQVRNWGETLSSPIDTNQRRGDRRAEIAGIEIIGAHRKPTEVWVSGEAVEVRVTVKFNQDVFEPVIGILLRNRIGLDVYGTNTAAENVKLGPCTAGQTLRVNFRFHCDLCPQEYTLTVASHDPDGVRHDWIEEAVAISVTDSRYTAGVANLRARVTVG